MSVRAFGSIRFKDAHRVSLILAMLLSIPSGNKGFCAAAAVLGAFPQLFRLEASYVSQKPFFVIR